ncbi:UDP-glucuronosyl/UDP-glucosyltransferase [Trema orientale]|uniref:Glycosyltransferase n=1 Tax=Trema orientale TaxID=63057 RepID=A0A2P5FCI7_TREOI|nr:UDP-glucuronosyl/UDP-glucosyltransferase [Trema orientale]
MARPRFILVTYPAQGHINPSLQFAKRLAHVGADVTFVTAISAHRRMAKGSGREPDPKASGTTTPNGSVISFVPFSDGYDDGFKHGVDDYDSYRSEMTRRGTQAVSDLVVSAQNDGRPYTCLVYTLLLPWAGLAADALGLPSVLLWIQPATVFDAYYYYFHGHGEVIRENSKRQPPSKTTLPGLSLEFAPQDLPSFMDAADTYSFVIPVFQEQFEMLEKVNQPRILVNTFDELEAEALRAVRDLSLIGIGPLIPSAFLDERDPSDKSFGGDLFRRSEDKYMEWLNSKPKTTVVYVSFGSILNLSRQQMEEIAKGLLSFGRPFLWVIREKSPNDKGTKENDKDETAELSCREELEKLGMIVPWCSQVEVLSSESLGCFVTHCGWNSTLESLASGVPVVAFPKWTDQGTNAKLIEEVWKTGVRVKPNEEGIVQSEEIKRCLGLVMEGIENGVENGEEKREEMRRNAKKWKNLAREAVKEDGSSDKNLKAFVADMIHGAEGKLLLE